MMANQVVTDLVARNRTQTGTAQAIQGFERFGSGVKKVIGAAVAYIVASKLTKFGADILQEYGKLESAQARLSNTLQNTGGSVGYTMKQLEAMREDLRSLGTQTDVAITKSMQLMAAHQLINGEEFKRAQRLALDLAETMGGDMVGASEKLTSALEDPVAGLNLIRQSGRYVNIETETLVKSMMEANDIVGAQRVVLGELEQAHKGLAATMAETTEGKLRAMKNQWQETKEMLGSALAPAFKVVMDAMRPVGEWMISHKEEIAAWGKQFVDTMKWIGQVVVAAYVYIETIFTQWANMGRWLGVSVMLAFVQMGNTIAYWTGVAIEYIKHWGTVFLEFFTQVIQNAKNFFANLFDNFSSFFKEVGNLLTGGGFNWEWKSMEKGFEMTFTKMKDIAEREKGDLEKVLEEDKERYGKEISDAFGNKLIERIQGLTSWMNLTPGGEKKKEGPKEDKVGPAGPRTVNFQKSSGRTSFEGLDATWKRIQSAAMVTPEKQTAENTAKIADNTAGMKEQLAQIATNTAKKAATGLTAGP